MPYYFLCLLHLEIIHLLSKVLLILYPPTLISIILFVLLLIFYLLMYHHDPTGRLHPKEKFRPKWLLLWWYWIFSSSHYFEHMILSYMFYVFYTIKNCYYCVYVFCVKKEILPVLRNFTTFTYMITHINITPIKPERCYQIIKLYACSHNYFWSKATQQ